MFRLFYMGRPSASARLEETLLKTHYVRMSEQSSSGPFKNVIRKLNKKNIRK